MSNGGKIVRAFVVEQHEEGTYTVRLADADAYLSRLDTDEAAGCIMRLMYAPDGVLRPGYGGWTTAKQETARHNRWHRDDPPAPVQPDDIPF